MAAARRLARCEGDTGRPNASPWPTALLVVVADGAQDGAAIDDGTVGEVETRLRQVTGGGKDGGNEGGGGMGGGMEGGYGG